MKKNTTARIASAALLAMMLCACGGTASGADASTEAETVQEAVVIEDSQAEAAQTPAETSAGEAQTTQISAATGGQLSAADLFTDRDLTQNADLSAATYYTLADGQDITITEEGAYVLQGSASDVTVYVEAEDTAKVQIVLDGASISNTDMPAIYVKSGDKVFVTTTSTENSLTVSGSFAADGDTNLDAAIFSKSDLVLNGTGSLTIVSSANGVSSKDDLKITGGTLSITASADGLEANDSVAIAGGSITIASAKDAIHAEYDDGTGYVYICGGTLEIQASDDGIQGTELVQIDGGTIGINAVEGIEATYVQINDGSISIYATDDGINATDKAGNGSTPVIEINGGELTVEMAQGDTDALDSNGYLYINGGTVAITAQFAFDFVYGAELNGGTVTVNGEQVSQITESMMMGGGMGTMGGEMGGQPGGDMGAMGGQPGGGMRGPGGGF